MQSFKQVHPQALDRPTVHSVFFYDRDSSLVERLAAIVSSGLLTGNSVLVVATEDHRRQLAKNLLKRGVDAAREEMRGRLGLFDAAAMLETFMLDGRPDSLLFEQNVGKLLADAKYAAQDESQGLTVFGEMVAVLWAEGNKEGALELEALWNDVLSRRDFYLHCAYPRQGFSPEDEPRIAALCHGHSHVFGAPAPVQ